MIESNVIALEAAWELDPVRLDDKLWDSVDESDCRTDVVQKTPKNVENTAITMNILRRTK